MNLIVNKKCIVIIISAIIFLIPIAQIAMAEEETTVKRDEQRIYIPFDKIEDMAFSDSFAK